MQAAVELPWARPSALGDFELQRFHQGTWKHHMIAPANVVLDMLRPLFPPPVAMVGPVWNPPQTRIGAICCCSC